MIAAEKALPKVQHFLKEMVDAGDLVFIPRFDIGIFPHNHETEAHQDVFLFKVETSEMIAALGLSRGDAIYVENQSQYVN